MRKGIRMGIPAALLIFGLILTGCPQPEALSSDATLKSITVSGIAPVSLGRPNTDWLQVRPGNIYLSASQLKDAKINVSVSSGADVWYSVVPTAGGMPWFDKISTVDLNHENILWVEIFSANLDAYLIYAFMVHNRTPLLSSVNVSRSFTTAAGGIAGNQGFTSVREAVSLGTPAVSWNAAAGTGELWVGTTELAGTTPLGSSSSKNIRFVVTPETSDSVLSFALASGNTEPVFTEELPAITTAKDGDWLYIKCVSADTKWGETVYYKIKLVEKDDNFALSSVSFNGTSATPGNVGYHSLVGQEAWGSYYNGATMVAMTLTGGGDLVITATPVSSKTTLKYGVAASNIDYLIGQFTSETNLGPYKAGSNIVGIEATNELGETAYYRFNITRSGG